MSRAFVTFPNFYICKFGDLRSLLAPLGIADVTHIVLEYEEVVYY